MATIEGVRHVSLHRDEVRDLLEVHFALAMARDAGDTISSADVAALASPTLTQAMQETMGMSTDPCVVDDVLQRATNDAMARIDAVDKTGGSLISLQEIARLAADPSPASGELATLLRGFHQQLVDRAHGARGGKHVARHLGDLATGIRARILGNNESDSALLPFHARVHGSVLEAKSRADVCRALTLPLAHLDKTLVTDYNSAAPLLQELSANAATLPLAQAMQADLRGLRAVLLGGSNAPDDWRWQPIVEAILRTDDSLLPHFLGGEATAKRLAAFWQADDDPTAAEVSWNLCQVPVLVAGTANDGSLVGLLGCVTWT